MSTNKTYEPTPGNKWAYNEKLAQDWHVYKGPCPYCGGRTFNYGGGWRCLAPYCYASYSNPIPNLGLDPDWWLQDIDVKKDGSAWCARKSDFINLQESIAGFGDTPQQSVLDLRKRLAA